MIGTSSKPSASDPRMLPWSELRTQRAFWSELTREVYPRVGWIRPNLLGAFISEQARSHSHSWCKWNMARRDLLTREVLLNLRMTFADEIPKTTNRTLSSNPVRKTYRKFEFTLARHLVSDMCFSLPKRPEIAIIPPNPAVVPAKRTD